MYMEDVCSIKRTDDGKYVVQVMPPRKKEKAGKNDTVSMPEDPKTYVANDEEELVSLIREYVPSSKTDAQKFEKGFNKK